MPNSLRAKVKHLAYKGILTQKESDKIRDALLKQKPQKWGYRIEWMHVVYICPSCDKNLALTDEPPEYNDFYYCPKCGQRLKWEEQK